VFGVQVTHTDYGFRKLPYVRWSSIRGAFGTASARPGLAVSGVVQTARPSLRLLLDASAGGIDVLRFYTPGNESLEADDRSFHEVRNWQVTLAPAAELALGSGGVIGAGPTLHYVHSELEEDRLIASSRPYGSAGFGALGARAYARWDARDVPANARRGFLLDLSATLVPGIWDAEESFGGAYASASTYLSRPGTRGPALALRIGGQRIWGRYPYFEAARLGGDLTVRGYSEGRFLGDAALFSSAELRAPLGRATLLVPGEVGLVGFTDVGRVFLDGESSEDWHEAIGGGLWFAALGPANVVSLTLARSPERTTLRVGGGMAF
jgi:hypothetical protein